MKDIFLFDTMITPQIITFVYWLLLFVTVLSGIGAMMSRSVVGGLFLILFGILASRIWCELLIVLFKINENITKIANKE